MESDIDGEEWSQLSTQMCLRWRLCFCHCYRDARIYIMCIVSFFPLYFLLLSHIHKELHNINIAVNVSSPTRILCAQIPIDSFHFVNLTGVQDKFSHQLNTLARLHSPHGVSALWKHLLASLKRQRENPLNCCRVPCGGFQCSCSHHQ